ncbi:stage III sporulation protein AD [Caproiciproducens galactitolivorans]|uniref:Stage III sporulation protein AC/AD protein family protein n=1 Tax=Caproiciproducens galactitolivorans TaxID=642589 RepID=A0A4Z0XXB2_9FIRM|nr:SpoIIIAC/SpoIIIAD family protein [Caproiciproducens galactitolivorans]QEY33952.1 stage III sporulation protein AD [Caproiciproducens galactitolivorans]TGJ76084.1 stage III sporulation protein AC/AD protein family protein [Caproiciproducens galactitolivorans]
MNIVAVAGISIIAAILSVMMKRYHHEYSVIISICAGLIILFEIMANVSPAVQQIHTLLDSAGISSEYAAILLKSLGICFLAQFAADSCRDAGESALASKVELAGKVAIVVLSLPLFEKIASTAVDLIGGGR